MSCAFSCLTGGLDWPLVLLIGVVSLLAIIVAAWLLRRMRAAAPHNGTQAENAEQKLREQNVRLDTALNNMTQGLCMFDASERIVVYNRRFLELYRLSPEVVRPGCTLRELIHHRKAVGLLEAEPEQYLKGIRTDVANGNAVNFASNTTDGRLIQWFNQPMPGGGWVTTHEDITERRHAEEQVREQRLQLDTALNNMTQGLLMFDSQARLVICNWRYLQMYDLPASFVKPGLPLQDLLKLRKAKGTFSRDPKQYIRELQAALAEGKPVTLIADLADGRVISVANHPMRDGRWVSTHEDITERRHAEERLREQKLQLDTALNNMSQGLNMFDADGRLVVCNQRYMEMYRVPPEIAKPGCTVRDLVFARIASRHLLLGRSGEIHRRAAGGDAPARADQYHDGIAGRSRDRGPQPADARRQRLGGDARGHHRAPQGGEGARSQPGPCLHGDRERAGLDHGEERQRPALHADQPRRRGLSGRAAREDDWTSDVPGVRQDHDRAHRPQRPRNPQERRVAILRRTPRDDAERQQPHRRDDAPLDSGCARQAAISAHRGRGPHPSQTRGSPDRAHGAPRSADRAAQPRGLHRMPELDAGGCREQQRILCTPVARSRSLQGDQRRLRPCHRRRAPSRGLEAAAGDDRRRVPGAAWRRRVHRDRDRRRAARVRRSARPTG